MHFPEQFSQRAVGNSQTRFYFLRQKHHPFLKKPVWYIFLAFKLMLISTYLNFSKLLQSVIIKKVYFAVSANTVISGIKVLVKDICRHVVFNAVSQIHYSSFTISLRCRFKENR